MPSRSVFTLLLTLSTVAACSSEPASNAPPKDSGVDGDTRTEPPVPCTEPVDERPKGGQCVKTVTGKVLDTEGKPVGDKIVSVCGAVCFFSKTNPDGAFSAAIGQHIVVADFAASVHGRPHHASLYEKLPVGGADTIALPSTLILPTLAMTGAKIPMDDKRVVTSAVKVTDGDITLSFEAGTELELDLEDLEMVMKGEPGDHLRVVKVAEKDHPTFAKGGNLKVLYAASPFDLKFVNKKVGVAIKGTAGLAEGAAVEIVGLGNEFLVAPFTAGKLEIVATGKVVGDSIVTDAGQGLKTLTWIGIRAK